MSIMVAMEASTLPRFHFLIVILVIISLPSRAQLYPPDLQVLKDVRSALFDQPGSFFFDSWDFSQDPCSFFRGVFCSLVNGAMRVRGLNLGTGLRDSPGLRGELHPSMGRLSALKQLTVAPGEVGGSIPDSFEELLQLEFLGISKNWLSGPLPKGLQELESLRILDLSYNQITGSIPKGLAQLPNLKALILRHNNLVGSIPAISSPLVHLDLRGNMFSGNLPILPTSLDYLCLSKNELSGTLDRLVPLNNLGHLDLSFNQFTGGIPPAIFEFRLSHLLLHRNRLSGEVIPPKLVRIYNLDLGYNTLSGHLSPLLATAISLHLNNNRFTGEVPQEYVDQFLSGSLQNLYLQHNFLTDLKLGLNVPLPVTSTLCIEFNCLDPAFHSNCPASVGNARARPAYECM